MPPPPETLANDNEPNSLRFNSAAIKVEMEFSLGPLISSLSIPRNVFWYSPLSGSRFVMNESVLLTEVDYNHLSSGWPDKCGQMYSYRQRLKDKRLSCVYWRNSSNILNMIWSFLHKTLQCNAMPGILIEEKMRNNKSMSELRWAAGYCRRQDTLL